jgi:16S rRNA (cytosine967-C5)-methyltransferase
MKRNALPTIDDGSFDRDFSPAGPPVRHSKPSPTSIATDTARGLAFAVLEDDRTSSEFALRILDRQFKTSRLVDADRRLSTELVAGTVRRRLTLDTLLERHVSRPRPRVEEPLWTLLQLGAFQLLFLGSVPAHAAVHETVELARRIGRPQWTGLLNAALRSLARTVTDSETTQPGVHAFALSDGKYRLLTDATFPDPQRDPPGYVSRAFSFPLWLTERWLPRFGWERSLQTAFWFNEPHGVTLRVNPLRAKTWRKLPASGPVARLPKLAASATCRDEVLSRLAEAGLEPVAGGHPQSICLPKTANVSRLPGFDEGLWTPQDESAIAVSQLLAPLPGETVLDLCAAPGTKTTHIAELMQDSGRIVATDVNADRLPQISENARRLGLTIIESWQISPDLHDVPEGPFDAVLVDAPCSNTGVLGKRPEVRWRIHPRDIAELAALQQRLLRVAADRVKPGGRLVYSTCSMEPEENEGVVAALLDDRFDLRLEEQHASLPGQPCDGGFRAKFLRAGPPP